MSKPKLLISTDSFPPKIDGTSRFVSEIIPYLTDTFNITVIAPDYSQLYKNEKSSKLKNIKVIKIPLSFFKFGDYRAAKFRPFFIKEEIKKSDLVFINVNGAIGSASIINSKIYNKAVVNYVHVIEWEFIPKSIRSNWLKKPTYFISLIYSKFLYNLSDLLIVPSQDIAEKLSSKGIMAPKTIVPIGINTKRFKPPTNKYKLKQKYHLENYFIIGFCSRLAREKDPETALKAFRLLRAKYKDMRLLVIGEGLKEYEEKFNKNKNVIFLGRKKNVEEYYKIMDVFYFTSLTETTGLVLLEAMASGLPVISTKVGIANYIIKHRKNGFLFEKKDYLTLSKITEQLYKDRLLRENVGKNARKTVENSLSFEKTANQIKKVLLNFTEIQQNHE